MTTLNIEALVAKVSGPEGHFDTWSTHSVRLTIEDVQTILELIAQRAALVEALRPLARCEIIEPDTPLPDADMARYAFTMGEIRAAIAALKLAGVAPEK